MPYHKIGRGRPVKRPCPTPVPRSPESSPEPTPSVPRRVAPGGAFARWSGPVSQWMRCDAGLRGVKLIILVGHPGVGKTHGARFLLEQHCQHVTECAGSDFAHPSQLTAHLAKFVLDARRVCGLLLDEFDALLGPEPYKVLGQWLTERAALPMHPIVATCNSFHDRAHKAFLDQNRGLVMRVTVPKPSVADLRKLLPSLMPSTCPPASVRRGLEAALQRASGDIRHVQRALAGGAGAQDTHKLDFFAAVSAMCTGRATDGQRSRYARPDVRVWVETHVLPAQVLHGGARRNDVHATAEACDALSLANVISTGSWPDTEVGDVLVNYAAVPLQCNVAASSMWLTQSEWSPKKGVAGLLREGEDRLQYRLRALGTGLAPNTQLPSPGASPKARIHPVLQALHYPNYK